MHTTHHLRHLAVRALVLSCTPLHDSISSARKSNVGTKSFDVVSDFLPAPLLHQAERLKDQKGCARRL